MKTPLFAHLGWALLVVAATGCATATAWRTPIGPNQQAAKTESQTGTLRVFSAKEKEANVGFAFPHEERTDYYIYDSSGNEVKGVFDNNKGEFEPTPRGVRLAPGTYNVRALAAVGMGEWVSVPVVIEAGRTTEVHLNGQWRPPADAPRNEVVYSPAGFPMGWRAER